jgi:hypothetical protein
MVAQSCCKEVRWCNTYLQRASGYFQATAGTAITDAELTVGTVTQASSAAVRARLRLFAHEIEELLNRCIELPRQRQSQ